MSRDQGPGWYPESRPRQPARRTLETDPPPATTQNPRPAAEPTPWADFGRQVLAAHHRNGLGAQCICGSLVYHCPVIAAAERLGLPTDDPGGRG